MDLTGLTNRNGFYADYYLHSLLAEDLKGWVKTRRQAGQTFWVTLQGLGLSYRESREAFRSARSVEQRLEIQRAFVRQVLNALDYSTRIQVRELDQGLLLPLVVAEEPDNRPYLWVVEALDAEGTGEDLLMQPVSPCQIDGVEQDAALSQLIDAAFFMRQPPRWIIVVSLDQLLLLDRTKWAAQQALHLDWSVLLGGRDTRVAIFQLIAMLLSRPSIMGDTPMMDQLQQRSRTHNQGISGGLKYALREAVELLGQEYVRTGKKVKDPDQLTNECLRYLYRLLFLFSVEARPQLGYLPMNALLYREGFSLEKLRDLEFAPLHEEQASEGTFLHDSLMELFDLIYQGRREQDRQREVLGGLDTFSVAPLKCDLFDWDHTPLLGSIKIRNGTWQQIIRRLSLSETGYGMGRISYGQLGINHLGEVYEALLSYAGFIAQDTLYEVKPAAAERDVLAPAHFVTREALEAHYTESERVYHSDGTLVCHPKGKFIYRLTGRAKETSASYYTPESLTRCVVRYALKEAMTGKKADELLGLTICEPAMGSAAFLNEAVSQLAEAYMARKTKELKDVLPPEDYARHLQRVKLYLADNNVYGVDLNPMAVELGGVSLWLNTLEPSGFVPWFGNQINCGNALVGAWRRVYSSAVLTTGRWWQQAPEEVLSARPGEVYHFLLGDPGMAHYTGGVIKNLAGEALERIRQWKRAFTQPLTEDETARLTYLSQRIDALWAEHVRDLQRLEQITTDPMPIYGQSPASPSGRPGGPSGHPGRQPNGPGGHPVGQPTGSNGSLGSAAVPAEAQTKVPATAAAIAADASRAITSTSFKDGKLKEVLEAPQGAYKRLKLVMDYWCALWFWPISKAALLPTRAEYISDLGAILAHRESALAGELTAEPERDAMGATDIEALMASTPRLGVVKDLAERERFLHWPLVYADQFYGIPGERGGFDVVLGNPPWLKSQFEEKAVMSDKDARFAVKKLTAPQTASLRQGWMEAKDHAQHYVEHYESALGEINFQNAMQNYPLLKGMQTNLYKSFITVAWALSKQSVGLLHPGGVYDDPKGQNLRAELYRRLRCRFQFTNELALFPDVHHATNFSINIYGTPRQTPEFVTMANVFDARTVEASMTHDGHGPIPRIKTDDNKWDLIGHQDRVIPVDIDDLKIYAQLYDSPNTPALHAKMPGLHCRPLATSVRTLAQVRQRIQDFKNGYHSMSMWHETNAQKAGFIRRETRFTVNAFEWIASGPHIFVGNPFFKTPNPQCRTNSDYTRLDLTRLPIDYRPRTNYVPARDDYAAHMPRTPWGVPAASLYRVFLRRMFGAASERSCIATILPPGVGHIDTVNTIAFKSPQDLLQVMQGFTTVVMDFLTKISGKADIREELWSRFPVVPLNPSAVARVLGLTCLTQDYAELWNEPMRPSNCMGWSRQDPRLDPGWFTRLNQSWQYESALRTDYARWQAQIELDVLFAQACGLTLEQLQIIYQMQFPVLVNYERDTWYDQTGRIVFSSKSHEGILPRSKKGKDQCYGIDTPQGSKQNMALGWTDVQNLQEGQVHYTFTDDTQPGDPTETTITCHAPFERLNREEAYAEAWAYFEEKQYVDQRIH